MREIKFRAWSKDEKRMLKNVGLLDGFPCVREKGNLVCYGNCEIMQYTGLKDESGREIYEGDIVRYKMTISDDIYDVIVFKNGKFMGKQTEEEMIEIAKYYEVIGNIYEDYYLAKGLKLLK